MSEYTELLHAQFPYLSRLPLRKRQQTMGGTTEAYPFRPFVRIICVRDGRGFLVFDPNIVTNYAPFIEEEDHYEYRKSDEGAAG